MTKEEGLAEHTGLEPILPVSKTDVLPLHQCSMLEVFANDVVMCSGRKVKVTN